MAGPRFLSHGATRKSFCCIRDKVYLGVKVCSMRSTYTHHLLLEYQSQTLTKWQSCMLFMDQIPNWDCEQIEWRAWLNSDLRRSDTDLKDDLRQWHVKIFWRDWHTFLVLTRNHAHSWKVIMQHKRLHWKCLSWKGIWSAVICKCIHRCIQFLAIN